MSFFKDSKKILSFAQAEGRIIKLHKLIQLDRESLLIPDGFMNRHAKIEARMLKLYAELKEAEQAFQDTMERIAK